MLLTFCSLLEQSHSFSASRRISISKLISPLAMKPQIPHPYQSSFKQNILRKINSCLTLVFSTSLLSASALVEDDAAISRADVGFIDLNETQPTITDVCWLDVQIGDSEPQRVEISLFGTVVPKTVKNFKALCMNDAGYGYRGSDIFRIISQFSVQGGNIGSSTDTAMSRLGRDGRAADGVPFQSENYRILHSYKDAGVISMMRDITNQGTQDSRFFITLKPYASWADDKYTAFGLITKGMSLITGLSIIPVQPPSNYPLTRVRIIDSGCY